MQEIVAEPLDKFRMDTSEGLNYAVGDPFEVPDLKKRASRPKQLVVCSTVGPLKAGGAYLIEYTREGATAAFVNALHTWLSQLGSRFDPPILFYLMPSGTKLTDLSSLIVAPPKLAPLTDRIRSSLPPLKHPDMSIRKPLVTVHDQIVAARERKEA